MAFAPDATKFRVTAASASAYHSNSSSWRAAALSIQPSVATPSSVSAAWIEGIESTEGTLDMPISASTVRKVTAARTPPYRPAE